MASSIPSITLQPTGLPMPLFGLGTWQSGVGEVRAAVTAALEAGYRHIDCAAGYGNEHEVGAALTDCIARGVCTRADVFITSKLWVASSWPDLAMAALDKTLADLQTSYVDLYLIHWPFVISPGEKWTLPPPVERRMPYDPAQTLSVWRILESAVDAGKCRHIGVSNFTTFKLHKLLENARIPPSVNQVESHPFLTQADLIAWSTRHGIATTAFSPLGSPARPARMIKDSDPAPLFHETVLAIAVRHKKSAAHVLIKWQVQRGVVVIPKSVTPARIVDNANIMDFELSAEDMASLSALDANHRLNEGASWLPEGKTTADLWDVGVPVPE